MIISLNPTYLCNFRCSFCYLTREQLADENRIEIGLLTHRMSEVASHKHIEGVDLYGGEITYLDEKYVSQLLSVIKQFYSGSINVITNLSFDRTFLYRSDINVVVSWDFKCREKWLEVYERMKHFPRTFRILMLASKCLLRQDVEQICDYLNSLPNLESVEIKPYSSNQANDQGISFKEHEEFIKGMITSKNREFELDNVALIEDSLNRTNNAFSDDHAFLNPNGKFSVLEFDEEDREYFKEFDNFDDYLDWTLDEKKQVYMNGYCSVCPYFGSCLSEHLREVKDINQSCNGYKLLLDWYSENYEIRRYKK